MKLVVIIALLLYGLNTSTSDPSCDKFKVEAKVTNTTNGLSNGEVEIEVEGGEAPYKYIFLNEKGRPIALDYDSKIIKNRHIGSFYCTVVDKNGCQKKIKLEVK